MLALAALLPSCAICNALHELVVDILGTQAFMLRALARCACLLLARGTCASACVDVLGRDEETALGCRAENRVRSLDLRLLGFSLLHEILWQERATRVQRHGLLAASGRKKSCVLVERVME